MMQPRMPGHAQLLLTMKCLTTGLAFGAAVCWEANVTASPDDKVDASSYVSFRNIGEQDILMPGFVYSSTDVRTSDPVELKSVIVPLGDYALFVDHLRSRACEKYTAGPNRRNFGSYQLTVVRSEHVIWGCRMNKDENCRFLTYVELWADTRRLPTVSHSMIVVSDAIDCAGARGAGALR
jgi:hypothetical protein